MKYWDKILLGGGVVASLITAYGLLKLQRVPATLYNVRPSGSGTFQAVSANGVEFQSADPGAVISYCIGQVAVLGGGYGIALAGKNNVYPLQTVPKIPYGLARTLRIFSDDGTAIIQLTPNAPRAFDPVNAGSQGAIQNLMLDSFVVDCNNTGGRNHVIFGTYINGGELSNLNFANILIRNITAKNIPVDPTLANHRLGIWITPVTSIPGISVQHVTVDGVRLYGGNQGITIAGATIGQSTALYLDDINILNSSHSLLVPPHTGYSSANFFIGSAGYGGACVIKNCYGQYSSDVGVEVDAMMTTTVDSVTIEDAWNAHFYHTNFATPSNPIAEVTNFTNCRARSILTKPFVGAYAAGDPYDNRTASLYWGMVNIDNTSNYCYVSSAVQGIAATARTSLGILNGSPMTTLGCP